MLVPARTNFFTPVKLYSLVIIRRKPGLVSLTPVSHLPHFTLLLGTSGSPFAICIVFSNLGRCVLG